ncbi:D-alanyl-D-alanine carboxypeptidase family protein [Streptococcus sp. X16XC17]|uniref:LD-carboxypeptidase LdcB/DacB n=1 Tax=Streptococcus sp. X16XC17 TaxID=2316646 RepID=UPI00066FEE3B|nr:MULTISPECIES: LD-carboxypeptidase LdcB/DacB [unclassified Streptococcus]TCD45902.1 D-alanyl-D-alanine carboxypeptidase family protein [Streptococcus sp. X16XC17]
MIFSKESSVGRKKVTSQLVTSSQSTVKESPASEDSQDEVISEEVVSSSEPTVENKNAEITDNGTYYSVQGKYGPVIIVNKKHPVAAFYAPGEDPTALVAFQSLIATMQAQGFAVSNSYSGFRSYETQAATYNGYVASDSQANVDTYSARPSYSEHQTGLAFDLLDSNGQLLTEPQAANWLAQHAHEYGFVVRYLAGKESSTGYIAESWHVRYIGQEAADIYASGQTLEEYYGVAGGDYQE